MGQVKFHKNLVSVKGLRMRTIIFEYVCWVLSGKPENYIVGEYEDEN